ncbi:MAG: hypothetical protein HFG02_07870 [Oscillibacter sp.]|nr:hypothetical protein [Oscillibacter sp.]
MRERILELALAAAGGGEAERVLLEPLCAAAELAWQGRLRRGVSLGDCGEALACAAAFTAAADLAAGEGGSVSFSAGDISVKAPGGQERAAAAAELRRAAERLMEPYVRATDLWAKGVRG